MKQFLFFISIFVFFNANSQVIFENPAVAPGACMRNANDPLVPGFREDLKRAVFRLGFQELATALAPHPWWVEFKQHSHRGRVEDRPPWRIYMTQLLNAREKCFNSLICD